VSGGYHPIAVPKGNMLCSHAISEQQSLTVVAGRKIRKVTPTVNRRYGTRHHAVVAELVDASDLSPDVNSCGFESHQPQITWNVGRGGLMHCCNSVWMKSIP
jgi:hypothetical protein